MDKLCQGRVAIVTGAGRGIGRAHALTLAEHGASVVVNDLGTHIDGTADGTHLADEVAAEIVGTGGSAVANTDDVADWEGAQRLVNQAVETFGGSYGGLAGGKGHTFEGGIRVPSVVWYPAWGARTVEHPVWYLDVLPTVLGHPPVSPPDRPPDHLPDHPPIIP